MRTIKFVPKCCKGEKPTHAGYVELKAISVDEKYAILLEHKNIKGDVDDPNHSLNYMKKCIVDAKERYVAVDITDNVTGEKLVSYEDLDYDPTGHEIINEIATAMLQGFKAVGNG